MCVGTITFVVATIFVYNIYVYIILAILSIQRGRERTIWFCICVQTAVNLLVFLIFIGLHYIL